MKAKLDNLPAACPSCDHDNTFAVCEREVEQLFRNETFLVQAEAAECSKCGFCILLRGQTDALRQKTADAYRAEHGLLTSPEIRDLRASQELSQKQFAELVGVGVASIKRWEHCGVQDPSSDKLLRQVTAVGTQSAAAVFNAGHLSFSWNVGAAIYVPACSYNVDPMRAADWELAQKPWELPPSTPQPKRKRSRSDADFALAA